MSNFMDYLWIALLALYIISPFDAHPLFLDDLIAAGALFYFIYRKSKLKKQFKQHSSSYGQYRSSGHSYQQSASESDGPLTLEKAHSMLGVKPSANMEEVNRAYRDKMSRSHPDKVSHLSKELQEKAKELTLNLNAALDLIKRHKGL